jgi:hypothetical protein
MLPGRVRKLIERNASLMGKRRRKQKAMAQHPKISMIGNERERKRKRSEAGRGRQKRSSEI